MLHPIVHDNDILHAISMQNTQGHTPFEAYQAKGSSSGNATDLEDDITNVINKIDKALSTHNFTDIKQESLKLRARIEQLARILIFAMEGQLGMFCYTNQYRNTVTYRSSSHSKHYNERVAWQELIKHIASVPGIRPNSLVALGQYSNPPSDLSHAHEFTLPPESSSTPPHESILRHPRQALLYLYVTSKRQYQLDIAKTAGATKSIAGTKPKIIRPEAGTTPRQYVD